MEEEKSSNERVRTGKEIKCDRDPRFNARFWRSFQECVGTRLNISTAYHPQTDGQSEKTIQTLEDMLRACVMDFKESWKEHLPLIEFVYNDSYHSTDGNVRRPCFGKKSVSDRY
jgi:hypothetical protein